MEYEKRNKAKEAKEIAVYKLAAEMKKASSGNGAAAAAAAGVEQFQPVNFKQ